MLLIKEFHFTVIILKDLLPPKPNLYLLLPKPKFAFRHMKKGVQEFHMKFMLAPLHKAANNVVVV